MLAARRRRWAGLALATTAAGCGGVEHKVTLHHSELEADPVVDLQDVAVGDTVLADLNLYAVGTGDVELRSIESDHPAFVAEGWPDLLEEGEMATLQVTYTPTAAAWDAATLTIKGDMVDGDVTSIVRVHAGLRGMAALPGRLDFGPVAAGDLAERMIDIGNHGDLTDTLVSATASSPDFEVTGLDGAALPPGDHQALWVSVSPAPEDALSATLVLEFEHAPPIEIPPGANDCEAGPASAYDQDGDGVATCAGDCDDTDAAVSPGAVEQPNGVDDDCDGLIDEGTAAYDDDGDGDAESDGDCNDHEATTFPGATELEDRIDNDCDGAIDEGTTWADDDGDGWTEAAGDCDNADSTVFPAAQEVTGDGIDNDCDGPTL